MWTAENQATSEGTTPASALYILPGGPRSVQRHLHIKKD